MSKVAVAMSGGVDSSVAAALAVEEHGEANVFGVTMKLFCYSENESNDKNCCSLDAINDAATVCRQLGIPHYVVNLEKEFEAEIVENFVSEYELGRTPNPCIRCNRLIKFEHLLRKVQELGAEILVTGHYARIVSSSVIPSGTRDPGLDSSVLPQNDERIFHLLKGLDSAKDQSYFLFNMSQEQLKHVWFPLGDLTKAETRKLAEKYGLKTAQKTESQDICFITTSTQEFLSRRVESKPGNMVNTAGDVVGRHGGLPFYTVGQRKGLGGGFEEPAYVIGLNLIKNEIVVGKEEELYSEEMVVGDATWVGKVPELPAKLMVKIRYNSDASPATVYCSNDKLKIRFLEPQRAITPGQSAVFYLGDEVMGGGIVQ